MVYIDDYRAPFRGVSMCHMIADTDEELDEMAAKIGLLPGWKHQGHYDVCLSKKKLAIKLGAKEVTVREIALKREELRRHIPPIKEDNVA